MQNDLRSKKELAIYTFQAMIWLLAMSFSAAVIGQFSGVISTTTNKKSFQAEVNCPISHGSQDSRVV